VTTESTTPMQRYWFCPLYGFDYNGEQVDLPEGVKIIKIPREFVEYLDRNYPDTLPTILSEAKWVTAIQIQQTNTTDLNPIELFKLGSAQNDNANNQLVDLITALRLHQKGRIVAGLLTSAAFHNSEWSVGGSTIWTSVSNILFFEEEPTYKLRQSDLQKFITLFQQIRQWRDSNIIDKIEIALERFHSSYHDDIEDRIIDQMIAFESLFLSDNQELTYKLSLRAAFLLGNTAPKRDIIVKDLKKAYNYRSRIVHGDNPPSRDELRLIVPKTEEYLRQSIRRFFLLLSQGYSLKEIRDNLLDENILKNGETLALRE